MPLFQQLITQSLTADSMCAQRTTQTHTHAHTHTQVLTVIFWCLQTRSASVSASWGEFSSSPDYQTVHHVVRTTPGRIYSSLLFCPRCVKNRMLYPSRPLSSSLFLLPFSFFFFLPLSSVQSVTTTGGLWYVLSWFSLYVIKIPYASFLSCSVGLLISFFLFFSLSLFLTHTHTHTRASVLFSASCYSLTILVFGNDELLSGGGKFQLLLLQLSVFCLCWLSWRDTYCLPGASVCVCVCGLR